MKIVQVAPLTNMPLSMSQNLSYQTDIDYFIGAYVLVPLRNRLIGGIVTGYLDESIMPRRNGKPVEIKSIDSGTDFPVLSPIQIELAMWMHRRYLEPLGKALKLFLPFSVKKPSELTLDVSTELIASITGRSEMKLRYILGDSTERFGLYLKAIFKNTGQTLVLFSDQISLERFEHTLQEANLQTPLHVIRKRTTKRQRLAMQADVVAGKRVIVAGTRSALFVPFADLELIIMDDEANSSYESYEQHPYYQTWEVARKLQQLSSCQFITGGSFPSVRAVRLLERDKVSLPLGFDTREKINIHYMVNEFRSGNHKPFSQELLEQAVTGKQYLIYVNRRGKSPSIQCNDCGQILSCPHDQASLVEHTFAKPPHQRYLLCHRCERTYKVPEVCPACGSYELDFRGLGIEKIAQELAAYIPGEKIEILDRDRTKKLVDQEHIIHGFKKGKVQVLLATAMIEKFLHREMMPENFETIVVNADALFSYPDYDAINHSLRLVQKFVDVSQTVHLQTFFQEPDELSEMTPFSEQWFLSLFAKDIDERKQFKHPPYSRTIEIVTKNLHKQGALEQALHIKQTLQKLSIRSLGPVDGYDARGRGWFTQSIFVKTSPREFDTMFGKLATIQEKYTDCIVK
jgi:primosomal protein N' (replication factor Y)